MMCIKMKTIIPDTSAVIEGAISKIIAEEDLDYPEIIVPEAVVCELEHQANANRNEGINGLKELQKLQEAQDNGELAITFKGKRPTNYDIKYAKSGEIDSLIRDLARSEFGTLVTNDKLRLWKDRTGGRTAARSERAAEKCGRPRLRNSAVRAGLGHSAD